VNVFVAPTDLSLAQIERGARCDLIFALAGAATDEAARGKTIHADSITRALRNSLVLVGNAAPPGTGTTLADFGKLISGKRLAIANPDRDVAGAQALDLLRKIGIIVGDNNNETVTVAESSAGVVSLLSTNKARLGIVYATDATSGFKLTLPLPALERAPIDYIVARARDPEADTQPFMAFLKSPEAKTAFKSAGLIPLDD
jgi:molybdenum ABC transporter molybdate-binding protein